MVKMSYYADYSNYTDWHEVDEDLRSIIDQGGRWDYGNQAGIIFRNLHDSPAVLHDTVASRCCTIQKK